MSGHTYTHHTHTQNNYSNPRCAHARRGLITGLGNYRTMIGTMNTYIYIHIISLNNYYSLHDRYFVYCRTGFKCVVK